MQVEAGLVAIGASERARAQELSLEQHIALAHALESAIIESGKHKVSHFASAFISF